MLYNYILIALRNLNRQKGFSFINVAGLAIGIAGCILIAMFIIDELQYDRYHEHADNIYRVQTNVDVAGNILTLATTSYPMADALKTDFPQIRHITRVMRWNDPILVRGENKIRETQMLWADASVFDVFSWKMVEGDPSTSLRDKNSVILTQTAARKYFGTENPIGKTLRYDGQSDLMVRGIIEDVPSNSHVRFEVLGSLETLSDIVGKENFTHWHAFYQLQTFAVFPNSTDRLTVNESLPRFVEKYLSGEFATSIGRTYTMELSPLLGLHLEPQRKGEFSILGSKSYIITFSVIAFCLLGIACINFTNLTTARAVRRNKEIGLRKVFGAQRSQLINQFLGETQVVVAVSVMAALLLVYFALPYFNALSQKQFTMEIFTNWKTVFILILFSGFVGWLAGWYPAFYLSRYNPLNTLKGTHVAGHRRTYTRQTLVGIQFGVSITLIIVTLIIHDQLNYMHTKDMGLAKEQIVVIPVSDGQIRNKYQVLREKLINNPIIENASISTFIPGSKIPGSPLQKIPANPSEKWEFTTIPADENFVPTMGISLLSGHNFTKENPSELQEGILLNESAAREIGWAPDQALDQKLSWGGDPGYNLRVIGVVKDFHFASLHQGIKPLVIVPVENWPQGYNFITIRIHATSAQQAITHIQNVWNEVVPETPCFYSFLDDDFSKLYAGKNKLGRLYLTFSVLTIIVACLGLLGLAAFVSESRKREMSIRKVVGATSYHVIINMLSDFLKPVMFSLLLSWPAANYFSSQWLQSFAYRIDPGFYQYFLATLIAILIASLTLLYHAVQAGKLNPAQVLKNE